MHIIFQDKVTMMIQNLWGIEKAVQRRKFIAIQSYMKIRKISNKQPNLTSKATREKRTKKNPKWEEG